MDVCRGIDDDINVHEDVEGMCLDLHMVQSVRKVITLITRTELIATCPECNPYPSTTT